jgi:hypothetical protein
VWPAEWAPLLAGVLADSSPKVCSSSRCGSSPLWYSPHRVEEPGATRPIMYRPASLPAYGMSDTMSSSSREMLISAALPGRPNRLVATLRVSRVVPLGRECQ